LGHGSRPAGATVTTTEPGSHQTKMKRKRERKC
jgi:hypothetical protein